MLQKFDIKDTEELSKEVTRLSTLVSSMSTKLEQLQTQFATHQHGGGDGSSQIYNESIKLKPGSYLQGGIISAGEGSTIEIKDGSVTALTSYHTLKGEGGVDDILQNINLKAAVKGQLLILRGGAASSIRIETNTGNLRLVGDFIMVNTTDTLALIWSGTTWNEISRANTSNRFTILGDETELTIASGVVTATTGYHTIDTEGNAATDNLDTINIDSSVRDGAVLVICPESTVRDVVAKDGIGNLRLAGDFTMTSSNDTLTLIWSGTLWKELSRSSN